MTWNASAGPPARMISSPSRKTLLRAQPAIVSRCAGASVASAGTSVSSSAIVCMAHVRRTDGGGLLGDVDGDGAPGDAAAAADAAGGAELVDPGRQLVGHPLPVARTAARAHAAAVDVGVVEREAGVPGSLAHGLLPGEVRAVLNAVAEAGRAD